ncbi:MAG: hypothetical protein ABJG15_07115 [Hyphomonadaceae bacterium]
MVWLVTHIWMFIGAAALFGLILGWALRGIRFSGGARRAMVERDIALTELSQVRGELDSLYSAQRAQDAGEMPMDTQLQADIQAREARMEELEGELAALRDELESVKADSEKKLIAAAAAAAAAGGGAAAIATGGSDEVVENTERLDAGVNTANAQTEWRNRYLESRVRSLETQISSVEEAKAEVEVEPQPIIEDQTERVAELEAGNQALKTQIDDMQEQLAAAKTAQAGGIVAGAAAGAGTMIAGQAIAAGETTDSVETEKAKWQNEYLRQRVAFLEEHGLSSRGDTSPESAADTDETAIEEAEIPVLAAVPVAGTDDEDTGDIEQELARLRWRNRYLEGRLAYIDGGATEDDAASADDADETDNTSAAEALLAQLEKADGDGS